MDSGNNVANDVANDPQRRRNLAAAAAAAAAAATTILPLSKYCPGLPGKPVPER